VSSVQQIYNRIFAGDTVKVRAATKAQYETLRTSLCKTNSIPVALEMTTLSVCGIFDAASGIATFKLAEPARKAAADRWQIVEDDDDQQP